MYGAVFGVCSDGFSHLHEDVLKVRFPVILTTKVVTTNLKNGCMGLFLGLCGLSVGTPS